MLGVRGAKDREAHPRPAAAQLGRGLHEDHVALHRVEVAHVAHDLVAVSEPKLRPSSLTHLGARREAIEVHAGKEGEEPFAEPHRAGVRLGDRDAGRHEGVGHRKHQGHHGGPERDRGERVEKLPHHRTVLEACRDRTVRVDQPVDEDDVELAPLYHRAQPTDITSKPDEGGHARTDVTAAAKAPQRYLDDLDSTVAKSRGSVLRVRRKKHRQVDPIGREVRHDVSVAIVWPSEGRIVDNRQNPHPPWCA